MSPRLTAFPVQGELAAARLTEGLLIQTMPSFFSPPGDHKLSPAGQAYWLSPSGDSAPPKAR